MKRPLLALAFFLMLQPHARAADPQTSLSMLGEPRYAKGFTHFDYLNPKAPQGGALKLGIVGTFDSLNPFLIRGKAPQGLDTGVFSLVYQSLMARSWDEPFSLYGLIAESVELPADRSWIVFHINKAAHWQDGQPLTADDVLFSFETLRDHGRPNHRTYYKKVAEAKLCGPLCIRFAFKPATDGSFDREMPLIMGLMPVLPRHDWQTRSFEETSLRPPVGSGPYKVASVDPGRSITYEKDQAFWAAALPSQKGMYHFQTIRMDYYRDENIALEAFKAGAFDIRRESDANRWAKAYDVPAVKEGRILLESLPHQRPEPARGFVMNMRRPLFADLAFRRALAFAFDDSWINKTLFQGRLKRCNSFFANSPLATQADALPEGQEKDLLEKHISFLPPSVLTQPVAPPTTEKGAALRDNLLLATDLLHSKGYTIQNNQLRAPKHDATDFEILLGDPADEKIALTWARALDRIGIKATVRTVDSAQYQARLTSFDYDVTVVRWINTLSPGNEQLAYWGSAAADQKGSRNYAGIKNAGIDALAASILTARTPQDMASSVHALDRALLSESFLIPFFYVGSDSFAYWKDRVAHPAVTPIYGSVLESWWAAP